MKNEETHHGDCDRHLSGPQFCINLNQVALDMAHPISSQARCCRKDIFVEKFCFSTEFAVPY